MTKQKQALTLLIEGQKFALQIEDGVMEQADEWPNLCEQYFQFFDLLNLYF